MIDFFLDLGMAFYNALPNSFIQNSEFFSVENLNPVENFLNYLNWMIPFDIASKIMLVWLPCILAYYIASSCRTVIKKLLRIFLENL